MTAAQDGQAERACPGPGRCALYAGRQRHRHQVDGSTQLITEHVAPSSPPGPVPGPTSDPPELNVQVGRIMRRTAESWHTDDDWPWLAALVLGVPELRDAVAFRRRHLALHVPVQRRPGSSDVVCAHHLTGWPCDDAVALGLATREPAP